MIIPHQKLSPETLRGVIEEFVTRHGTELTDADVKIEQVKRQLERGKLVITFDEETRTCNIVSSESVRSAWTCSFSIQLLGGSGSRDDKAPSVDS